MILCSGIELKKNETAVSKHLGILPKRVGNNSRVWVKIASTAIIVYLVGVSMNCNGL